jgi:hypothetical protein
MLRALDADLRAGGYDEVELLVRDGSDPGLPAASYGLLTSSLVLFFLPDPQRALGHWAARVADGGRIGISTFGPQDAVWKAVDALFGPYQPPRMLDARTSGAVGAFADDAGVEGLFRAAGVGAVRTVTQPITVTFDGVQDWRNWSMTTGQRQMWKGIPTDRLDGFLEEAGALLETARRADGRIALTQQVRYTLGVIVR